MPPKLDEVWHSFVALYGRIYRFIDDGRLSENQTINERRTKWLTHISQFLALSVVTFLLINTIACMSHR